MWERKIPQEIQNHPLNLFKSSMKRFLTQELLWRWTNWKHPGKQIDCEHYLNSRCVNAVICCNLCVSIEHLCLLQIENQFQESVDENTMNRTWIQYGSSKLESELEFDWCLKSERHCWRLRKLETHRAYLRQLRQSELIKLNDLNEEIAEQRK